MTANTSIQPVFNIAQTFTIDNTLAPNTDAIYLTSVDIFFKYMPQSNTNSSGINQPGVTIYIANTQYGIPQVTTNTLRHFARCEWSQITTSSDASAATNFLFRRPVKVYPGQTYAIVVAYDGNEVFVPWTAETGQYYVGTREQFTPTSSGLVGEFFEYASVGDTTNNPTSSINQASQNNLWQALTGVELTFNLYAARYAINGVPVAFSNAVSSLTPILGNNVLQSYNSGTGILTYTYPSPAMEAISFSLSQSTVQSYIGAQRVYQNCAPYPGPYANGSQSVAISCNTGNVIVTANTSLPNGTNFNWNTIFPSLGTNIPYIVLVDPSGYNVRRVVQLISNTQIQIDEPPTFTNTTATFLVTAVGTVDSTLTASPYGKTQEIVWLQGSNANGSIRFQGNSINQVSGYPTGTGYNNTDICYIKGYEYVNTAFQYGFMAVGNVVTNSTGGITNILFSNNGAGFSNSSNVSFVFSNSSSGNVTSNTSNGSGASLTANIGTLLYTEYTTNIFANAIPVNVNLDDATPFFNIDAPLGTSYNLQLESNYYMTANSQTSSGLAFYVQNAPVTANLTLGSINSLVTNTPFAFVSFSNEFALCYANGAINNLVNSAAQFSNGLMMLLNCSYTGLNDDYIAVKPTSQPSIEFGHYVINNSHFKEYTTSGNAWAKHITTMINFNQFAEDLRVYLTVYQPINTGFKVYAKIQNSNDLENFPQEDWTQLTQISGNGLVSSLADPTDYVELGFGFPSYPNPTANLAPTVNYTFGNTITTSNNSATITCAGGFNNATVGVPNNSLVRIYNTLFPNSEFIIAEVVSVASDTSLTLDTIITSNVNIGGNPAYISNSLALDVISLPHQAFNNYNNSNVVRYYNTSSMKYDGYNNLMLKVVFQSSQYSYIPQLNNIRALGVTA